MTNLTYHYQTVLHNSKDAIYLHEAFSTKSGLLYMVNPVPVEVSADSEEEMELSLKAMEADSVRYAAVKVNDIITEMERWSDEVDIDHEFVEPAYDDEENILEEVDHLDSSGEVIDICDYIMKRGR